jgi:hypothetical protein
VRGVNHEVTEISTLVPRLEARATTLKLVMNDEISVAGMKRAGKGLSSHDLATFNADVATVQAQLQKVRAQLSTIAPGDPARAVLEQRQRLLVNDVGALMDLLELPVNKGEFDQRVGELQKQGVDPNAVYMLHNMRALVANERIDRLLQTLKSQGIDPDGIVRDALKQRGGSP